VQPAQAGTAIACPKCNGRFQIPLPTAHTGSLRAPAASSFEVQQFASKKIAAGICGIMFGGLGVHKFVLGFPGAGVIMLSVSLVGIFFGLCLILPFFATMVMGGIGLAEGVIYLTKSDEDFYQSYAVQKRSWF